LNPPDKLTIETPEQIALELPLAGIGSRSMAFAFDILLQIAAIIILVVIVAVTFVLLRPFLNPVFGGRQFLVIIPVILFHAQFLIHWGYFIFF
jgi:uncharacterized RDD family membrane protein YckC